MPIFCQAAIARCLSRDEVRPSSSGVAIFKIAGGLLLAVMLLGWTGTAAAGVHQWVIDEVFSDASGEVQYIQMLQTPSGDGEQFFSGATLRSDAHSYVFPNNLPTFQTSDRHVLIATSAFAAQPGAVAPDFVLPEASDFFNMAGDTIVFEDTGFVFSGTVLDTFSFGAGDLPTDGLNALNRFGGTSLNAPTNFAGETGHVPEPATGSLLMIASALVLLRRRASAV